MECMFQRAGVCPLSDNIDMKCFMQPLEHEVNTSNVDNIRWKKGVKFYL